MRLSSHSYDFTARDLARIAGLPILPLVAFSLAIHLGAGAGLLPSPIPALDTDRTILLHQAEASRKQHEAEIVLIGDSSCLMNIAAAQLSMALPQSPPTLNLGTLSYLDLNAFSTILSHYAAANPKPPRLVVLLMHPDALRLPGPTDYHVAILTHFYEGSDYCAPTVAPVLCAAGVEIFRGRLWSRALPQPLAGAFGHRYGFTHDLWNHLSANRGSALDPGHFDVASTPGNTEFRLAATLEKKSRAFRIAIPAGAKLAVGITPVPDSRAPADYQQLHDRLLRIWSKWLAADQTLHDLPATLPDGFFASGTHLNERGVLLYTERLAVALNSTIQ